MTDRAQLPEDFFDAVEAVARELDARRTLRECVRDAIRTVRLFFVISWYHLARRPGKLLGLDEKLSKVRVTKGNIGRRREG